jgi:tRNA dimethylallyltransferase
MKLSNITLIKIAEKIRSDLKEKFPTPDQRYQELKRIDPEKALLVHKNDAYKVLRALEVYYITGRPLSQHYKLQQAKAGLI